MRVPPSFDKHHYNLIKYSADSQIWECHSWDEENLLAQNGKNR